MTPEQIREQNRASIDEIVANLTGIRGQRYARQVLALYYIDAASKAVGTLARVAETYAPADVVACTARLAIDARDTLKAALVCGFTDAEIVDGTYRQALADATRLADRTRSSVDAMLKETPK